MGKLVLFLADGTTLDIPLDRERVTVGRRAGNDVCLPYPPVSGEHAVFVRVPTGTVMEDLGSTNGTAINGKRVPRYFLHDGDRIEIGRQKLIYLADDAAVVPSIVRRSAIDAPAAQEPDEPHSAVAPATVARPETAAQRGPATIPAPAPMRAPLGPRAAALDDERAPPAAGMISSVAAEAIEGQTQGSAPAPAERVLPVGSPTPAIPPDELLSLPPSPRAAPPAAEGPMLKVVTGPNAGRMLALEMPEALVGRVGLQVVAIRKSDDAFRVFAAEGNLPLEVNGVPVPVEGTPLAPGDAIDVAGARIEFLIVGARAPAPG